MADLSKVKIDDVVYDIKDAIARGWIGDMTALGTEDQSSLVAAMNELVTKIASLSGITYVESTDTSNLVSIRDMESGTYVFYGRFKPFSASTNTLTFSSKLLVNVVKQTSASQVMVFYPVNNCVQYLKVTDSTYERKNVYLNDIMDAVDTLGTSVGTLTDLDTTEQSSLVAAINEVVASVGSSSSVTLDTTLTQEGQAADAKAVGDALSKLSGGNVDYVGVEPSDTDIPKVYFTGTLPTSKAEEDVRLTMHYISKTADFIYPVTLKVQGSSSANYAKKNFTLKLYKDSTYESKKKLAFKNWPEMNKFVLKAHWIDHSHVRNVGTAKIWGKIVESRSDYDSLPEELRNAPNNGATDGFTCKVFCNGLYQGLYEWIVPKDKLFGQDSNIATHSILNSEWNNQPTCAFATTSPTMSGNWSEELQDSLSNDISTSFANLIKFVAGSTDEEFVANAENYFDVQSVIDFDILARVFCIVDNLCRNQIFFTYDGVKWYEGCWDVDAILGLPPTTRGFFAYNTEFQSGYIAYKDYGVTNLLYQRVENLFLDRFKARYAELRSGVLSIENIIEIYERLTDVITTFDGLLAEDYASTTGGGAFTEIPYKTENTIQQIRNFVAQRIPYMDEQIADMTVPVSCTGISLNASTLTFTAEGSQTLTPTVTPDGCTDTVTWESDNTSVATVSGGIVTAVGNGSATITARCGEQTASCSVTVSGVSVVLYSITNTLTNVTNSNKETAVKEGNSYTATLTADNGYELDAVTVTMGGANITATVYADGVVNIASVTGNVVIVATATEQTGMDVANSFEESTWTIGMYDGVTGEITVTSGMYHSQLIPIPDMTGHYIIVKASANFPRISYFDKDGEYLGFDRGYGFNTEKNKEAKTIILTKPESAVYYAVNVSSTSKDAITFGTTAGTNILADVEWSHGTRIGSSGEQITSTVDVMSSAFDISLFAGAYVTVAVAGNIGNEAQKLHYFDADGTWLLCHYFSTASSSFVIPANAVTSEAGAYDGATKYTLTCAGITIGESAIPEVIE